MEVMIKHLISEKYDSLEKLNIGPARLLKLTVNLIVWSSNNDLEYLANNPDPNYKTAYSYWHIPGNHDLSSEGGKHYYQFLRNMGFHEQAFFILQNSKMQIVGADTGLYDVWPSTAKYAENGQRIHPKEVSILRPYI